MSVSGRKGASYWRVHSRAGTNKKKSAHIHDKFIHSHPYSCKIFKKLAGKHKKFLEVKHFSLGGEDTPC